MAAIEGSAAKHDGVGKIVLARSRRHDGQLEPIFEGMRKAGVPEQ
jgi:hypothetical protein